MDGPFVLRDNAQLLTREDIFREGNRIELRMAEIDLALHLLQRRGAQAEESTMHSIQARLTESRVARAHAASTVTAGLHNLTHRPTQVRPAEYMARMRAERDLRRERGMTNVIGDYTGPLEDGQVCSICLGGMNTECAHPSTIIDSGCTCRANSQIYGRECITTWLREQDTCPTCRNVVTLPLGSAFRARRRAGNQIFERLGARAREAASRPASNRTPAPSRPETRTTRTEFDSVDVRMMGYIQTLHSSDLPRNPARNPEPPWSGSPVPGYRRTLATAETVGARGGPPAAPITQESEITAPGSPAPYQIAVPGSRQALMDSRPVPACPEPRGQGPSLNASPARHHHNLMNSDNLIGGRQVISSGRQGTSQNTSSNLQSASSSTLQYEPDLRLHARPVTPTQPSDDFSRRPFRSNTGEEATHSLANEGILGSSPMRPMIMRDNPTRYAYYGASLIPHLAPVSNVLTRSQADQDVQRRSPSQQPRLPPSPDLIGRRPANSMATGATRIERIQAHAERRDQQEMLLSAFREPERLSRAARTAGSYPMASASEDPAIQQNGQAAEMDLQTERANLQSQRDALFSRLRPETVGMNHPPGRNLFTTEVLFWMRDPRHGVVQLPTAAPALISGSEEARARRERIRRERMRNRAREIEEEEEEEEEVEDEVRYMGSLHSRIRHRPGPIEPEARPRIFGDFVPRIGRQPEVTEQAPRVSGGRRRGRHGQTARASSPPVPGHQNAPGAGPDPQDHMDYTGSPPPNGNIHGNPYAEAGRHYYPAFPPQVSNIRGNPYAEAGQHHYPWPQQASNTRDNPFGPSGRRLWAPPSPSSYRVGNPWTQLGDEDNSDGVNMEDSDDAIL